MTIYKDGWLIIPKFGVVRFRKSKPTLRADEVAIYLDIRLPDALFVKPTLQATVTIKDEAVTPEILTPDIVITTADMIEKATGMKVEIRVVPRTEVLSPLLVRKCRICGCTEDNACMTPEGPCHWIEYDLCSACAAKQLEPETVDEPFQDEPYVDPDDMAGGAHDPDKGR